MEDYESDIQNLRRSNFEVTQYGNGYLYGKVNAEKSGILQFSTRYHKGWKVYVDGEQVDTLKSNKYFLAIEVKKGEHTIELKYSNPYIRTGIIVTILGIILFIGTIIYQKRRRKI